MDVGCVDSMVRRWRSTALSSKQPFVTQLGVGGELVGRGEPETVHDSFKKKFYKREEQILFPFLDTPLPNARPRLIT